MAKNKAGFNLEDLLKTLLSNQELLSQFVKNEATREVIKQLIVEVLEELQGVEDGEANTTPEPTNKKKGWLGKVVNFFLTILPFLKYIKFGKK